jgi:hypothetical protein
LREVEELDAGRLQQHLDQQRFRRRLQQHQRAANARLFCRTNGCATFMNLDSLTGIATCPICGARRRVD